MNWYLINEDDVRQIVRDAFYYFDKQPYFGRPQKEVEDKVITDLQARAVPQEVPDSGQVVLEVEQ